MSSQYIIQTRFTILFSLLSLAVSGLNSANAHFSIILRNRARSDYINTADGILDSDFQKLQSNALILMVFTALATTAFVVYGAEIVVHPKWLRDHKGTVYAFAIAQIVLAPIMIITGGLLADQVNGFYTSFEKFGNHDSISYYSLMYYGGVCQAACGTVLAVVVVIFAWFLIK